MRVVDRDGQHLGYALWNGRSQISLRFLSRRAEPPGPEFWARRIEEAVALRTSVLGLDRETNAYRAVHAEGDGLTGLIVDRFADVLSVEIFSLGMYQRIGPILSLCRRSAGDVAFPRGRRRAGRAPGRLLRPTAGQSATAPPRDDPGAWDPLSHPFRGGSQDRLLLRPARQSPRPGPVLRGPVRAGPVLLHRRLRAQRPGERPGREVTCVDLDEKAVALARENGHANQVKLDVVHADAFGYTRQMGLNGKTYGVIVLDPPKLIPDRDEIAPGKRKYFDLNVMAMKLVEPGGVLVTCSCSGLLPAPDFLALLRAAARKAERPAQLLALAGAAADHPVALDTPEGSYLKVAWLRMGDAG